jgi:hypothetical protein
MTRQFLSVFAWVVVTSGVAAAELKFGGDGLQIGVKGMGDFGLSWPKLDDKAPVEKKPSGKRAELTYPNNAKATMTIDGGKVELKFRDVPKDAKKIHVSIMIGPQYGDGGTWKLGDGEAKSFPKEKPAKPHLFQGHAGSFTLTDAANHVLTIGLPPNAYNQLQDNREWNWNAFSWQAWITYNKDHSTYTFTISEGEPGKEPPKVIAQVDRFGQTTRKEFPGKVKDEAELVADVKEDEAYYASFKALALDKWGGLPGSGEKLGLKATGFFHVEKKGERWLLVDPDGNAFFHLGICSFGWVEDHTYVKEREDIYEWLPPREGQFAGAWHPEKWWNDKAFSFYLANLIRKYGDTFDGDKHLLKLVDRVRRMGFNSIGAFSGNTKVFREARIPYVAMATTGPELPGIRGVSDPFDETTLKKMDESFSKSVAANAVEPLIIGYFFANEQGFEDIPRGVPQLTGKYAAKRKLVELLQKTYPTIAEFNTAWNMKQPDFESLADRGLPVATPQAFADMKKYTELFLDEYYRTMTETFRKHDKNHLMIGSRWQPGTANSELLCRAAGKYLDVISINYYTLGVDQPFMQRLYEWTGGKPQMWSEFYYTSAPESNVSAGNDMKTQKARGEAYRDYVEHGASLGYVIGIEWFTLIDQAVTGRWFSKLNGERNNTGIFNVADRPYKDMVAVMSDTHQNIYNVWLDGKKPFEIDDPRFGQSVAKMRKQFSAGRLDAAQKIDGLLDGWPGRPPERIGSDRIVSGKDGTGFEAAFKVAWDATNLYLLATVTDPTPLNNTRSGGDLWNGDGLELFIGSEKLEQGGALLFSDHQLLLAARPADKAKGDPWCLVNAAKQPTLELVAVQSVEGTGYTLEAAIPWSALGITPKENLELLFDLAVDDAAKEGGRIRQLMWNGGSRNSADRSYWGRLRLVP